MVNIASITNFNKNLQYILHANKFEYEINLIDQMVNQLGCFNKI